MNTERNTEKHLPKKSTETSEPVSDNNNPADRIEQPHSSSQSIKVGHIHWHVEKSGQGPLCLLLHGTGASTHSWHPLMEALKNYFTLVAVDLPGHARTQAPDSMPLTLDSIAASLNGLLHQEGLEPRVFIGHSAGAAIMVKMLIDKPRRDCMLVSVNGAVLPLDGLAGWLFAPLARAGATTRWLPALFARRARDPKQVQRLIASTGSTVSQDSLGAYQRLFCNTRHVAGVLRMMSQWQLDPLKASLNRLKPNTLLLAADGDKTIPLRHAYRLQSMLPQSQLSIIKHRGHLVHEEDPDTVAELILTSWENQHETQ